MGDPPSGKHPPPHTTRRVVKAPAGASPSPGAPRKDSSPSTVLKTGGVRPTGRLKTLKPDPRDAALHGEVEVVTSGDGESGTKVRRVVHGAQGLGLRQKIMIAMASVTIGTTLLIFVVVYLKATDLLSAEIDAKGVAQARIMASMDPEIWIAAMQQGADVREARLNSLVAAFDDRWTVSEAGTFLGRNPAIKQAYETLARGSLGEARTKAAQDFFAALVERRKEKDPALEESYRRKLKDESWKRELRALFDPFGEIRPLKAGGMNLLESGEIVQLSVLDITRGMASATSVAAEDSEMTVERQFNKRDVSDLKVFDGWVQGKNIPVRSFQLDLPPQETRVGRYVLRYYVLLSLQHIEEAKSGLRFVIFLPIFLAVLVGLAIAWWISERISEPVRLLMDDIDEVSGGNLDHETVPHSHDEVGQLAVTFNRMTQALRVAHKQELEAKAMEHELNIASEIQANLVPKKMLKLPGYDISAYYRPSKEVGGDYYDFIEIDEDHAGIIVADVSGKGVPGSLVMAMARAFVRMEAERSRNTSPSDTLKKVNRMLAADIKKGMFVTAMYCILNKQTNGLAVSSAGHNPMILWRAATNEIQLPNPKGIALGFDKGPMFDRSINEETVELQPGDRIVLYTDGTVEAMNDQMEEFGSDKFEGLIKQLATRDSNQCLNLLVKALDEHKGSAPQHDDMTIVTVRFTGSA